MSTTGLWRPATYVKIASLVTLIVATTACASKRVSPDELSKEKVQSAFNEENWDTYRSDRNYSVIANKQVFKNRVKKSGSTPKSSVAGR